MIKVSIIVPIYNVEKYLKTCIESILNQTLKEIEIICINDGSTDTSLDILNSFSEKDKRIRIINKSNSGYGATMNIGLSVAEGQYIGIVEPDDYIKENMFEELYILAEKNSADIVKSDFYYYFGERNQARKTGKISRYFANRVTSVKKYPELLKIQPSIWSAIYKKELIDKHKIKFLETPGASYQDTSFAFKCLSLAQRLYFTTNAYLYYRLDNENSSVNSKSKVFAICKEFDEITDFLNSNIEIKNSVNGIKLIRQYQTYFWNLKRIDSSLREEFIDKFSDTFKTYYENGEIEENFYKKIKKSEFVCLVKDKKNFISKIQSKLDKETLKQKRRKLFSIRINPSRISIVLFGRQIIEI